MAIGGITSIVAAGRGRFDDGVGLGLATAAVFFLPVVVAVTAASRRVGRARAFTLVDAIDRRAAWTITATVISGGRLVALIGDPFPMFQASPSHGARAHRIRASRRGGGGVSLPLRPRSARQRATCGALRSGNAASRSRDRAPLRRRGRSRSRRRGARGGLRRAPLTDRPRARCACSKARSTSPVAPPGTPPSDPPSASGSRWRRSCFRSSCADRERGEAFSNLMTATSSGSSPIPPSFIQHRRRGRCAKRAPPCRSKPGTPRLS